MGQEDPNKVFTVQGKSVQHVKISSDSTECSIAAICVLPDRQVLVADNNTENVKLLDQQNQVSSHWSVTGRPVGMLEITPSEVAVTVNDAPKIHEVQFITVKNMQLVIGRKLQLQHTCTVHMVAVSPTGERLYITNLSINKLLTLAKDGSVLASFADPSLKALHGVHVTPAG
ncbi:hypothetical protein DPMN_120532 [Dreissena polymorpha]|uniref:Uncharacterized protein n=1 Tax=Dreissena polymorpha TaxID=45954 RepID=A0A9D4GJZ0_DREPO|nr:hypothetical protein DPMN_120532 [Dreissena polymorpha]